MFSLNNYRPISVGSHVIRIIEKRMQGQLLDYRVEHDFISTDHSAFLKGHSHETCLHTVICDWLEHLNDDMLTIAFLLDIKKCIDIINHKILHFKLEKYGIRDIECLNNYISQD